MAATFSQSEVTIVPSPPPPPAYLPSWGYMRAQYPLLMAAYLAASSRCTSADVHMIVEHPTQEGDTCALQQNLWTKG